MAEISAKEWDCFNTNYPNIHFLQSSAWGELKSVVGWHSHFVQVADAGAQVLLRKLPLNISIAYIPKGPVGNNWAQLWYEIDVLCRQHRALFLKIEPDVNEPIDPKMLNVLNGLGQQSSPIQPRRTMVIDLKGTENDWLQQLKQKTRYNIGLACRKEIIVRPTNDVDTFYQMMRLTAKRDRFGIHQRDYYQKAYQLFSPENHCVILQAEYQCKALAAIMVFYNGERSWYLYGASTDEERNRMPTYLLQWEAMRWSAKQGCLQYDLWGVPDFNKEELEAEFTTHSAGLWGVYRFKRGFGAKLTRSVGAWDRVYNPSLYHLYNMYSRFRSLDSF